MRILIVFQKNWGKRIMENITMNAPGDWHIESHIMPASLPPVMDEPEDFLPDSLPDVDLLLSLGESTGVAELIPDFVKMTGAEAVIAPVDNRLWLPRGLQNQIQRKLEAIGVEAVFPTPFCSLTSKYSDNRHVKCFSEHFGRPSLEISCQEHGKSNGKILQINLLRDSPCGNARFVVEKLTGRDVHGAPEEGALLHQYYPCLASVDMIHKSAFIAAGAVSRALRT
jgi:hypothetical protein